MAFEYTIGITSQITPAANIVDKVPIGNYDANFFKATLYDKGYKTLMKKKYNVADVDISSDTQGNTSVFAVSANDESIVYNIGALQGIASDGTNIGPQIRMMANSTESTEHAVQGTSVSMNDAGTGLIIIHQGG